MAATHSSYSSTLCSRTHRSDSRCSPCPYFPAVRQAGPSPSSQATIKFAGCLMPFTLTILFLYLRLAAEYALWHHQTAVQLKRVIRSFKSRPAMFLNSSWASEGAGATHMPGSMALSYVSSTSDSEPKMPAYTVVRAKAPCKSARVVKCTICKFRILYKYSTCTKVWFLF